MLADAPGFLLDFGATATAVVAIIGACILVSKLRPVRWVYRRLVAEPLATWFREQVRHEVAPALEELRPNGGASFRDLVLARLADGEARFDGLEGRIGSVEERIAACAEQLGAAPPPGTP